MGLAASQARLLNLTARMHDIEYKAQNLEAQKLQMANESDKVYSAYEDALNATKIQYKTVGSDGSTSFSDATGEKLKAQGYSFQVAFGSSKGKVYHELTAAVQELINTNDIRNGTIQTDTEALTSFINAGLIVLTKVLNGDGKPFDGYTDGDTISTIQSKDESSGTYEINVATDTALQEISDETELKKAEAKYEADMRKINNKDKKFDTDLAALEAERNAIKTEIETLKSVAKDNVDRTYKLFS